MNDRRQLSAAHDIELIVASLTRCSRCVVAAYLTGSFENGSAIDGSDLDITLVVTDEVEQRESDALRTMFASLTGSAKLPLHFVTVSESELKQLPTAASLSKTYRQIVLTLKLGAQLIYGRDVRDSIVLPDPTWYMIHTMHMPYSIMANTRAGVLRGLPVASPIPDHPYLGYFDSSLNSNKTNKRILAIYGWIATARLAYFHNRIVISKSQCLAELASTRDEFRTPFETVYELCRNKWGYAIPKGAAAQKILRQLCAHLILYENEFLFDYLRFLRGELSSSTTDRALLALRRLQEWRISDLDIESRLWELRKSEYTQVRNLASALLDQS